MVAAGTAVAIEPAQEPERRPPAEPEPEPGPGLEPDARCVDDAGSEVRANTAVDPWEIGPLPSASNPVGNDIPADAPASEPQHVGGAVEPADLADTIDLTPVGDRDAAMPVREWRRMATTAGGILLAACVTVAGMSAWRSHESATAARELEQATADCATAHAAAKKAERKLVEYLDGDRLAQAKAVTADKLADPETLETLDKLAEQYSEGERIPACAATDTETANATTSKLQAIEKKHTGNLSRLKKAAGAVFSSRLAHTVEQGERLYSSSEGKVQDEYSRALLRASIDKRDEKAIADAMDKVNASIDAKTKADEERKAQEEAAAAAAAQAQERSTPAPQQYSYTPSGSAADTIPPAVPPARPVVPRLRAGRCPRTRTPRNCPAPTRAYERTSTMPQLTTLIPSFAAPVTDRVWLVGAHGGAGCTTIRHSDPDRFADAGRALPVSQDPSMPSRIILCAMGTGRGLESLRALLADQSAGLFGASILLGAAITDPAPRMPRPLVAARIQLSSAVRVWRLPHIKGLELDGFPRRYPAAYSRLVKDVDAMPRATAHVG